MHFSADGLINDAIAGAQTSTSPVTTWAVLPAHDAGRPTGQVPAACRSLIGRRESRRAVYQCPESRDRARLVEGRQPRPDTARGWVGRLLGLAQPFKKLALGVRRLRLDRPIAKPRLGSISVEIEYREHDIAMLERRVSVSPTAKYCPIDPVFV